jgi:AcrR family transcriptional regulator
LVWIHWRNSAIEEDGVLATLDGIAVRAGVGNATLYRNFPTRDDLLAAVMEANIAASLAEADELSRSLGPREALAEWLLRLTWQLRIWHDLPYCVASARRDPESSMNPASSRLIEETRMLLDEAKTAGMGGESRDRRGTLRTGHDLVVGRRPFR